MPESMAKLLDGLAMMEASAFEACKFAVVVGEVAAPQLPPEAAPPDDAPRVGPEEQVAAPPEQEAKKRPPAPEAKVSLAAKIKQRRKASGGAHA